VEDLMMRRWPVQDAKARFSEMLEASLDEGPQLVSKLDEPKAVLVSVAEWESLKQRARPTAKEVLLAPEPRFELDIPLRGRWKRREPQVFE
jgi:prevent-host-death family protein